MTFRGSAQRISVFVKLFAVFLVIMIPIYSLAYGIFRWGRRMAADEIAQSLETRTAFFMKNLENEISRIRRLQFECLNDADLYYYVNASIIMSQFEQIQALLNIQDRLDLMYRSSDYISNVRLLIPGMGRLVSAVGGVDPLGGGWNRLMAAPADFSMAGFVYLDGQICLRSAYPAMPTDPRAQPLYVLIIELSTEGIRDFLLSFNLYPEGGTILASRGTDFRISTGKGIDGVQDLAAKGYMAASIDSEYLNMSLSSYVSQASIFRNLRRYNWLFLGFSLAAVAVAAAFLISSNFLVYKPIRILVSSLKKMKEGNLKVRIEHPRGDEFDDLYRTFNELAASLEQMIELNYQNKILTNRAELKQLQSQINPHFLYNSFFILYRMAKDQDYENITVLLSHLSEYYRYITRSSRIDVPLQDEADHAKRYAQIQLIRFKRRICVDFEDLPEICSHIEAPQLILQPLLENAFNHGLKDVPAEGLLRVAFIPEGIGADRRLLIRVMDNGKGLSEDDLKRLRERMESDSSEVTALVNIHKRLRLKFGEPWGLAVYNLDGSADARFQSGFCQEIRIPLNTEPPKEEAG